MVETREVFDRAIDAVSAARAAIEHGVLPGGGVSLLYACLEAEKQFKKMDLQIAQGIKIKIKKENNKIEEENNSDKSSTDKNNNNKIKKNKKHKSAIEEFNLDGDNYLLLGDSIDINNIENEDTSSNLSNQIIYESELTPNSFEQEDYLHRMLNEGEYDDIKMGYQIVTQACKWPQKILLQNAEITDHDTYGKLIEAYLLNSNPRMGYDVNDYKLVDMVEAGLVDPYAVVQQSLLNAVSTSSMMLTTENVIVDLPMMLGNDQRLLGDEFDQEWKREV